MKKETFRALKILSLCLGLFTFCYGGYAYFEHRNFVKRAIPVDARIIAVESHTETQGSKPGVVGKEDASAEKIVPLEVLVVHKPAGDGIHAACSEADEVCRPRW